MVDIQHKHCFMMVGYPGSGKSTLAQKLAKTLNCHYFSSDEVRQKLFGTTRFDQIGDQIIQDQSRQAYEYMYREAQNLLRQRQKVVLDATHLDTHKRLAVITQLRSVTSLRRLCYVIVNPVLEIIDHRMATDGQELYEGWRRVYALFSDKEKQGLLSWPTRGEGIDSIAYEELNSYLDQ